MGMFDDIIVPKSYLRGLLDKKQEKLLKGNHSFQTKSLDNTLSRYKVYAQRLYKLERSVDMGGGIETWRKLDNTVVVVFYDTIKDKKENEWGFEFGFTFNKGKLDKKELINCKIETTKAQKDSIDKMWDTEQEIFDEYRKCFKYRFFAKLESIFLKLTNWARKKHQLPFELRKLAYEKSGRLKFDPKSLEVYQDL
jgi:hypothetical protein